MVFFKYNIPKEYAGQPIKEYYKYIYGLEIIWQENVNFDYYIDPDHNIVTVEAEIVGFDGEEVNEESDE